MSIQTPWAILLCNWKDKSTATAWDKQRYDDLFTASGVGKFNLVDYFRDVSHGYLDLSGSEVFDGITLDHNLNEYVGSGANQKGRKDLLDWAKEAATTKKVSVNKYFNVVVVTNEFVDLFGGKDGVVTGDGRDPNNGMTSLSPSLVAQEMAHGYGLAGHSKAQGSEIEYRDQWDVMSTASTPFMTPHPIFNELDNRANPIFLMGPGMNAANMYHQGWLDTTRLFTADVEEYQTVQLRPLHRHDLSGYLAAHIGQYFVEFRMPESWDTAIVTPVVLVHDFRNGSSYIQAASHAYHGTTIFDRYENYSESKLKQGLTKGDYFLVGDPYDPLGALLKISVLDITPADRTATIGILRRRDHHPKTGVELALEGATTDAGGYVLIGGKLKKIPPWSPLYAIAVAMGQAYDTEALPGMARNLAQVEAYGRINQLAGAELERLQSFQSPGKATMKLTRVKQAKRSATKNAIKTTQASRGRGARINK